MKLVQALLSIWAWFAIAVVCIAFFPFVLIAFVISYFTDPSYYLVGRVFRLSSVISIKMNPLFNFQVVDPVPKEPKGSVLVSNHLSFADTVLISQIPWDAKWVAKSVLFFIPIVGWAMYLAGDIPLWRGDRDSAKKAMQSAANWLQKGANVMIFPEGTRSRSGKLADFKDGAFRLAIENQSDILPLAVSGTWSSLPPDQWHMDWATGFVKVGKPISTKGKTLEDINDLKEAARKQIVAMTEELDEKRKAVAGTPNYIGWVYASSLLAFLIYFFVF